MSTLRDIQLFLEEAERELYAAPGESKATVRHSLDSADDQIDSFLIKFEADSLVNEEDLVLESLKSLSLNILLEQPVQNEPVEDEDEEPQDEEEVEVGEDEDNFESPVGSDRQKSDTPATPPKLPLDIDSFSKRVARLVKNRDALLDLETVIINRALNFLTENYDEEHARAMLEVLDEQFDFNIDNPGQPIEAPYAVGAYAGGTGQMGG
tara:strand:- start:361 stop:987 length:627 start_codon:yes stop_codon:yes gene_type:complete